MRHITRQVDGKRLAGLVRPGFVGVTVLVVPLGEEVVECAFRVMGGASHTAPAVEPRAATLDEIAEVADVLARRVEVGFQESGVRDQESGKRKERP